MEKKDKTALCFGVLFPMKKYTTLQYLFVLTSVYFYTMFITWWIASSDFKDDVSAPRSKVKEQSIYERNSERIRQLEITCRHNISQKLPRIEVTNSEEHKCNFYNCPVHIMKYNNFAFCFMHKVASTTFQSHLVKLAGFRDLTKRQIQYAGHHLPRYSVSSLVHDPFVYTYKFMFARHPFRRLVSAYYAKLVIECLDRPESEFGPLCPIAKHIVSNYRTNGRKGPVTFYEFVQYVIATADEPYDSHWTRMWRVCQPCTVHYDFIGKIESSDEDMAYVYKHLGIDGVVKSNATIRMNKSKSFSIVSECFSQLTEEILYQLYDIYKEDFIMFGYTIDEYLQYIRK